MPGQGRPENRVKLQIIVLQCICMEGQRGNLCRRVLGKVVILSRKRKHLKEVEDEFMVHKYWALQGGDLLGEGTSEVSIISACGKRDNEDILMQFFLAEQIMEGCGQCRVPFSDIASLLENIL